MQNTIVAIYSPTPGAGKTTIAEGLVNRGFHRLKFAGPLKDMLRSLLMTQGVSQTEIERMIEGDLKETPSEYLGGKTPRYAMQTLGTEWARHLIDTDYWLQVMQRKLNKNQYIPIVIDDLRFPNEYDFLIQQTRRKVMVVKILQPNADDVKHTHVSEGSLGDKEFDMTLFNDRSVFDAKSFAKFGCDLIQDRMNFGWEKR